MFHRFGSLVAIVLYLRGEECYDMVRLRAYIDANLIVSLAALVTSVSALQPIYTRSLCNR